MLNIRSPLIPAVSAAVERSMEPLLTLPEPVMTVTDPPDLAAPAEKTSDPPTVVGELAPAVTKTSPPAVLPEPPPM